MRGVGDGDGGRGESLERISVSDVFSAGLHLAMTMSTSLGAFCNISLASCNDIPRKRRPLTLMISSPIFNRPSL